MWGGPRAGVSQGHGALGAGRVPRVPPTSLASGLGQNWHFSEVKARRTHSSCPDTVSYPGLGLGEGGWGFASSLQTGERGQGVGWGSGFRLQDGAQAPGGGPRGQPGNGQVPLRPPLRSPGLCGSSVSARLACLLRTPVVRVLPGPCAPSTARLSNTAELGTGSGCQNQTRPGTSQGGGQPARPSREPGARRMSRGPGLGGGGRGTALEVLWA